MVTMVIINMDMIIIKVDVSLRPRAVMVVTIILIRVVRAVDSSHARVRTKVAVRTIVVTALTVGVTLIGAEAAERTLDLILLQADDPIIIVTGPPVIAAASLPFWTQLVAITTLTTSSILARNTARSHPATIPVGVTIGKLSSLAMPERQVMDLNPRPHPMPPSKGITTGFFII